MGVSVDAGGGSSGRKSVDVELNLVPFIDMMSCLVAFLLITAVWTNLAQLNVKPKGVGRDAEQQMPTEPPINLSILVATDSIWIGDTVGNRQQIKKLDTGHDLEGLGTALTQFKTAPVFQAREDIEIAGEDKANYQELIDAMDAAIAKGFKDIGFVDPPSLSVKFKQ
jgi:biopolymer transport protein ExbD